MNGIVTIGVVGGKATVLCNRCGKPVGEKGRSLCKECDGKADGKPMSVDDKLRAFRDGRLGTMGW